MSPLLIIAGVPENLFTAFSDFDIEFPEWQIHIISACTSQPSLSKCWKQVIRLANAASPEGAHIFAFHKFQEERKYYIRPYDERGRRQNGADIFGRHRLVWLPTELASRYGKHEFIQGIQPFVEFEQRWRNELRPLDLRSPLILPEIVFDARPEVEAVWERTQFVSLNHDDIQRIGKLIKKDFPRMHWYKGKWRDRRSRIFDHNGARHGTPDNVGRRWKFTKYIDSGFHYDVYLDPNQPFEIRDHSGQIIERATHFNVDPHGVCRPGSLVEP